MKSHIRLSWRFLFHCLLAPFFLGALAADLAARTYYIDSATGGDASSGMATNAAWQSLAKVNGTTFQPGDVILFKAGGSWTGLLHPGGSGATNHPIVINSYGTGPQPVIDGNGLTNNGVVYLYNQQYWEINNLEVIDDAATGGDRRGVYLSAGNFGVVEHLHVQNCYIHNIKGIVSGGAISDGDPAPKRTGGIIVETTADSIATRFDDVLIANCVISTVDNEGIALNNRVSVGDYPGTSAWNARRFTHVVIRGNSVNDVAKNAMVIRLSDETGLIEHNVCYDTADRALTGNTIFARSCRGTVFQFNEGYLNRTHDYDGCLYDADLQSPACVFQYSYSHDNNHGLFWMDTDSADGNVIVRYNISQNDRGSIFCMNYPNTSAFVYNNTVYIGAGLSPTIIDDRTVNPKTYSFFNNIIYNLSPTAAYQWKSGATRTFDCNVFYGQHPAGEPADAHKLTNDPRLLAPGTGGTNDLGSVTGYQLQAGSPCIDSGLTISTNLTGNPNSGGRDFWGNPVPFNGVTDRGANEWPGAAPSRFIVPGNLYVYQIGDGNLPLTASGAAIYIDQFTNGTWLSQLALPANGPSALIASGNSVTEGSLSLSPAGDTLVFMGYNTNLDTTFGGLNARPAAGNNRAVGTVNVNGTFSIAAVSATFFGPATGAGRGAVTDGSGNYWGAGIGNAAAPNGFGVDYYGTNAASFQVTASGGSPRSIGIYGGVVYYTASTTLDSFSAPASVGAAAPATTVISDAGGTPQGFVFNASLTVCYIAEGAAATGGIRRYDLAGGLWTYSYTLSAGTAFGFVAADFSGPNPVIYATTLAVSGGGNKLEKFTDAGASSSATLLATAPPNENFNGIVFASATAAPVPPLKLKSPALLGAGSFRFSLTNTAGLNFKVYAATNLTLAWASWTLLGTMVESPAGQYQFVDPQAARRPQQFYQVRWP